VTPNKYHKALAVEAHNAGKHVFCEKPPALNAEEMEEMFIASRKSGKTLMFDFNSRARSEFQTMMRYIRERVVGKINSAQACGYFGFWRVFYNKGPCRILPHREIG
jgi:predicted dehydrogenase